MLKLTYTKEPGTWVMFVIAFITGALKTSRIGHVTVLVFVSLTLFLMAKGPVSSYLKNKDKRLLPSVIAYILIGSAGSFYSILRQPYLVMLYGAAVVLIIFFFFFLRKGFPLLSEACGMAAMGLVASIAASTGSQIYPNLYLWGMFFAFYFASSFRVRLTTKKYRTMCIVYSGIVLMVSVFLAVADKQWIYLSFLPLVEDLCSAVANKKESFKRLGIVSTIKAVIFAALVAAS